jgi:tripartite-type tricarboxylate transporter receptor subunit TctC
MERFSSVGLQLDRKNLEWGSLRGLAVLKDTPAADLAVLDKGFAALVKDPVFVDRMAKADFPYVFMDSAEFSSYMKMVVGVLQEMLGSVKE